MKWQKLSPYAMQSGQYTISKCYVDGKPKYTLWEGEKMVGIFDDAEAAKGAVKEVEDV